MCGVSASENRQNRVSHGESVRVGSSEFTNSNNFINAYLQFKHLTKISINKLNN